MEHGMWFLQRRSNAKRILIHAINHVGLGHMNRAISVAQWLKKDKPDLQVLFLIEGGEELIEPTGFPWIAVPGQPTEREHCEEITRTVLDVFRPDLAIHETVLREQIHQPVREAGVRQVLIGNVGDLLRMQFRNFLPAVREVSLVVILQQREEVLPADQELIARYQGKTIYAGPLVRQKRQASGGDLRRRLGLTNGEKVILLTLGGGGWDEARGILTSILDAKAQILAHYPQARLIVITGPHFAGELPEVDEFVCYASKFEPFLTDFLDLASAMVCMAGYSTINEVAANGVPAICVPVLQADDQIGRGSMSEYAQAFPNVVVSRADSGELAQKVIEALGRERDLSVTREFWRRAESASERIVREIKSLL